jgi:alpha-galactosidase
MNPQNQALPSARPCAPRTSLTRALLAATSVWGIAAVQAVDILWIDCVNTSSNAGDGRPPSAGWLDLLETTGGHTVTTFDSSTYQWSLADQASKDYVNSFDVVIVTRTNNAFNTIRAFGANWKTVSAPMIETNPYMIGGQFSSGSWSWLASGAGNSNTGGGTAVPTNVADPADPIWNGVTLLLNDTQASNLFAMASGNWFVQNGNPLRSGISVVASNPADSTMILIAYAEPGALSATSGPRYYINWGSDNTTMNYNDDGKRVFLNAIDIIAIPEPNSLALLGLGGLVLMRRRRNGVAPVGSGSRFARYPRPRPCRNSARRSIMRIPDAARMIGRVGMLVLIIAGTGSASAESRKAGDRPVRVFLLAGQSNMVGQAQNNLLEHQARATDTMAHYAHLRNDDEWIVRDDVLIKFQDRRGGLSIGYGARNRTGVELEFGTAIGNHFDEPVLLVKTAWGGRSLFRDFRPPSSGLPDAAFLQFEWEEARKRAVDKNAKENRNDPLPTLADVKASYGESYRMMVAELHDVLAGGPAMFPQLAGMRMDLTGLVWFQGWNDMFGDLAPGEYERNLTNLIDDLRREFGKPGLPVVIAAMGQNGSKPAEGNMEVIKSAQFAMNEVARFQGTVRTIPTDILVDRAAEDLYPTWRQNLKQWQTTGSDFGYHYFGSAIWFNRIGRAMADTMLDLLGDPPPSP